MAMKSLWKRAHYPSHDTARAGRRLRLVKGEGIRAPEERVVAEILSDGSIREVRGAKAWDTKSPTPWDQGTVAGEGWTLWWERRPWVERSA
ncbi:MAG TPA: hypothetical protein VKA30_00615 [Actinomycetota bacterium]|nr:hypothetical protein [Actinomycetota bacterium]